MQKSPGRSRRERQWGENELYWGIEQKKKPACCVSQCRAATENSDIWDVGLLFILYTISRWELSALSFPIIPLTEMAVSGNPSWKNSFWTRTLKNKNKTWPLMSLDERLGVNIDTKNQMIYLYLFMSRMNSQPLVKLWIVVFFFLSWLNVSAKLRVVQSACRFANISATLNANASSQGVWYC